MGKRFYLGLGILVALLVCSLLVTWAMETLHDPVGAQLDYASELALQGETEQAYALARQAQARWQQGRRLTASVADHGPMDDVEDLFREMEVYAQAEEVPHFAACCAQLGALMRAMWEAHSPSWWNLL